MSTHLPEPLPRNRRREALDSMGGYDYQVWQSIEAWFTLAEGEVLFLEGAEDIDRSSSSETVTWQIRRTSTSVSLNSQSARDAIKNYWETCERAPGRSIKYVYLTTSEIATENDGNFDGLTGIEAWARARYDAKLAQAIKGHLQTHLEADHPIRTFIDAATIADFQAQLLRRFTWMTGQGNVAVVEDSVLERAGDALERMEQPRGAATQVKNALFDFCWKQVLIRDPAERRLDVPMLWDEIRKAVTIRLDMPLSNARGVLMATAQLGSLQSRFANLALLFGSPSPPPRNLLQRTKLFNEVERLVLQRTSLILTGSAYKGKTTIAQVVAERSAEARWIDLSQRLPAAVSDALKLTSLVIDQPDCPDLLIFDDLDTTSLARRTYGGAMQQLIHRAALAGKSILFTAQGHSAALERSVVDDWGIQMMQVPEMSIDEVTDYCQLMGCSDASQAGLWGSIVAAQSNGHPALVHVRLKELQQDGWPALSLHALTEQSNATKEVREAAIDLLADSYNAHETAFTLEASEFLFAPSRAMLLNLAELPPPLIAASTVIGKLTGRWLEELPDDRFRVTPVLKGQVGVTWTARQHRDIHAKLSRAIATAQNLNPRDAAALIFHAFIARHRYLLTEGVMKVLIGGAAIHQQVAEYSMWVVSLDTSTSTQFSELEATLPALRQFQFMVASHNSPKYLQAIAAAWLRDVGPPVDEDFWRANRVMYDSTVVLQRHSLPVNVILDSAASLQRFSSTFTDIVDWTSIAKAVAELSKFGPPETASTFQRFASLQSGSVKTRKGLLPLITWLEAPTNAELISEFDQIFEWHWVVDLGGFIHTAWVGESNETEPDWSPWPETFDALRCTCRKIGAVHFATQIARAKAIVLSEYMNDLPGGFAAVDEAIEWPGPSVVLEEQRVNLFIQQRNYSSALATWDRMIELYGSAAVSDPFAYRRAAIAAGETGDLARASELFEIAAAHVDGLKRTRVGLLADASYCALRAGDRRRCAALLVRAVMELPSDAALEGDKRWEAVIQMANATAHLYDDPNLLIEGGAPLHIAIGKGSGPTLEVEASRDGQGLRVGLLEAQVALIEAEWPDASVDIIAKVRQLAESEHVLLKLSAAKALLHYQATHGTSEEYFSYAMALVEPVLALAKLRREKLPPSEKISRPIASLGLLAVGLFLATSDPLHLLTQWECSALGGLHSAELADVLGGLRQGLSMGLYAATDEAVQMRSGVWAVCYGAAIRVCRSGEVRNSHLVGAAARLEKAADDGASIYLQRQFKKALATNLAGKFAAQLGMPAQFQSPGLALPAIRDVVTKAARGAISLRGLLVTMAQVSFIDLGY